MSRKRNRHHSYSKSFNDTDMNHTLLKNRSLLGQSTTISQDIPYAKKPIQANIERISQEKVYNRNISYFRQNFNQNDVSQLPFMSSLRQEQSLNSKGALSSTICFPFDVGTKTTCNQSIKKRISDFNAKTNRLATSYYRWHNKTGRNNKWAAQFQCSLRDYGQDKNPQEKQFYPYVKPITYKDVEQTVYDKKDIICHRQRNAFKTKP